MTKPIIVLILLNLMLLLLYLSPYVMATSVIEDTALEVYECENRVVYVAGNITIILFNPSFYNFTYRNTYVYIGREPEAEVFSPKCSMIWEQRVWGNTSIVGAENIDMKRVADIIRNTLNAEIYPTNPPPGSGISVGIVHVGRRDRETVLRSINELKKIYGGVGKLVIYEISPFLAFKVYPELKFNKTTWVLNSVCDDMGLKNYSTPLRTGVVGIVQSCEVYSGIVVLSIDEVERLAKESNMSVVEYAKSFIDKARSKIPESIPLELIVAKTGIIMNLPEIRESAPTNYFYMLTVGVACITIITIMLFRRIRKTL